MTIRRYMRQLSIADEQALINQIRGTHDPEGDQTDHEPILKIAEEIFNLAMAENAEATKVEESQKDGDPKLSSDISSKINTHFIEKVYSSDDNEHSKTMSVLHKMSSFSWEVKLALSLAGAAFKYGEFARLAKGYLSDELPPAMSRLKGMTENRKNKLKQRLDDINSIITSLLSLFKSFVRFNGLLTQLPSREGDEYQIASKIRILAGYWTIRGAITCTSFVAPKTSPGLGGPSIWELYRLRKQIDVMEEDIQSQIQLWSNIIEEEKKKEAYNKLATMIDDKSHENNLEVLKELIPAQGDEPPLYDGSNKAMEVHLDILSKKTVLLLISKVDIAQNQDLLFLSVIYDVSRSSEAATENRYEVVWFPIWDNTDTESTFGSNRTTMQWYSVKHPQKVNHNVLELVKKKFHYHDEPILVVLDPNGNVVNYNAFDMMWTWGNRAFPFSKTTEEALWKDEKLRLDLVVINGPYPDIQNWVKDEKYIIVYGGDEVEWISKFVTTTNKVKQDARIPLEILYVGMSNRKERATKILKWMKDKEAGHFLAEIDILFFWNRLEHMKRSKIKGKGKTTVGEDPILQGLMKLLSYDQNGSWAALFKGAELVVIGHGDPVLLTINKYCDEWKGNTNKGFDTAFKEYFDTNKEIDIYSTRVVLPSNFEETIDVLQCCECNRNMAKHIMFNCSHGH
ncbi:hypothetical protein ACJIZ3_024556 [Penstemon smallii]|uniref:Protein SIEVE ELEMENT OCCLUSION B-like n=1 Tax=Penstemon smallii TaxID=265156 RepID=A0ABD3TUN3_9LAMI